MAAFSNYLENKLIDWIFRAEAAPTFGASLHVALHTADPTDAGGGAEVSGGAYARVAVTRALTTWEATQGGDTASTGTTGATFNQADITFPTPTANWGVVTHFGIWDAATTGNLLIHGALTTPKTVNNGDPAPKFLAGDLDVTLA